MCGIFAYINRLTAENVLLLTPHFDKIKHRGPDSKTVTCVFEHENLFQVIYGFHRLAIMGLDRMSDQPIYHPEDDKIVVILNPDSFVFPPFFCCDQNNPKRGT